MPAQDSASWPFDIALDEVGYMLARGPQGEPAYREEVRSTTDIGERVKAWSGFAGGMGVRRESAAASDDETAYYLGADLATGSETVGGGLDIRFGDTVIKGPLVQEPVALLAPTAPQRTVRRLVKWHGLYWAAVGHDLVSCANPDFSGALSVAYSFANAIVDLCPFAGQGGASELHIALDGAAAMVYDGVAFTADGGSGAARSGTVLSFATVEAGAVNEQVSPVTDANPATAAALGGLTTANGHLLVGAAEPFTGVQFDIGTANTTACTVTVEGWDGSAWQPMTLQADTTQSPAGTSLGQDGHITWQRPSTFDWQPSALVVGLAAHFYARLHWSADLHSGATVAEASTEFRHEADGFTVVADHLIMSTAKSRWWWTDMGGAAPTWNQGVAYATPDADVVCLFTARNAGYVHKLDGLYTVDADGIPAQVARYEPPLVDRDETPHCVWLDSAYLEMGRGALVKFDPNPGGVASMDVMGPERLNIEEASAELVRVTSVVGDRNHFLFATVELPDGASVLAPWGTYRQIRNPRTGVLEWARYDAWSVIAHLRQRCVTAMQVWTHSDGSTWLVMGDDDAGLLATRLPSGVSPLGDPDYRYTTVDGILRAATFTGEDPSRPLVVYGAAAIGRQITPSEPVYVQTVDAWGDPLVVIGDCPFTDGGGQRLPFPQGEEAFGRGVDMRLVLHTGDPTTTPIVDRVELYYQGVLRAQQLVATCTVLADDDVRDLDGAQVEWGHRDWLAALDRATANVRAQDGHTAPVRLVRTDGSERWVLVQGRQDAQGRRREGRAPARAVTLTLVTAEGGTRT
jgi:hypothetical protein